MNWFSFRRASASLSGCVELWATNERAHRHIELASLECDVIALPCRSSKGGDLWAVYSCSGNQAARIVLADSIGHGMTASAAAEEIHHLLHKFSDAEDAAALLTALNNDLALAPASGTTRRLTTVVAATLDHSTGELNFAYAAHPRMLHWRARETCWQPLGRNLEGLLLGFIPGEVYNQQSVRLEPGDIVLAFSDGVTDVESPQGELLTAAGFLELARKTLGNSPQSLATHKMAELLIEALRSFHGARIFEDDLTLLTLRRPAVLPPPKTSSQPFFHCCRGSTRIRLTL